MTDSGLLDIPNASVRLGVTPRYIRRLVAERRIPYYKVGYFIRFSSTELDAWLEQQRQSPRRSA